MSDAHRKDFSSKVKEAITPQSQKSTYDKAKESVTDTYDKAASYVTPDSEKSFSQRLGDSVQKGHDEAAANADADAKTWSEATGDALDSSKQAIFDAAEYLSSVVTGTTYTPSHGAARGSDSAKK